MHRGIDELLMRAGVADRTAVSLDHLRASFHQDVDGATSSEAVWLVISTWLDAGRDDDVRSAIAQFRAGFRRRRPAIDQARRHHLRGGIRR
jgi:hypothetical protein